MELSRTSKEIVSEALGELGIPEINEVKMPKSTAFYFILKDLGPRFAKSQKMSDEEYETFKEFVKALYSDDIRKAKKIDHDYDFVSYVMKDTKDGRIPKFPLSFYELFGGSELADDAKKMKVATENL